MTDKLAQQEKIGAAPPQMTPQLKQEIQKGQEARDRLEQERLQRESDFERDYPPSSDYMSQVTREAERAKLDAQQKLAEEELVASESIEKQEQLQRAELLKQRSEIEAEAAKTEEQARIQAAKESRKGDLPGYGGERTRQEKAIAPTILESKSKAEQSRGKLSQAQIELQKSAAKAYQDLGEAIKNAQADTYAEINKWRDDAIAKFKAENVYIKPREIVLTGLGVGITEADKKRIEQQQKAAAEAAFQAQARGKGATGESGFDPSYPLWVYFKRIPGTAFEGDALNGSLITEGGWISKEYYDKLTPELQAELQRRGIGNFNAWLENPNVDAPIGISQVQPASPYSYEGVRPFAGSLPVPYSLELSGLLQPPQVTVTGEGEIIYHYGNMPGYERHGGMWFRSEDYEALPQTGKNAANEGAKVYQKWAEEAAANYAYFEATHVQVGSPQNNEWITKSAYEEMGKTPEGQTLQKILKGGGFKSLNDYLSLNNVQLKTGEWINKAQFEAMPELMQKEAMEKGYQSISLNLYDFTEFKNVSEEVKRKITQDAIDSNTIAVLSPFKVLTKELDVKTKSAVNNVANEIADRMDKFGLLTMPDGSKIPRDAITIDGFKPIFKPMALDQMPIKVEKDASGNYQLMDNRELAVDDSGNLMLSPNINIKLDKLPDSIKSYWTPPESVINDESKFSKWCTDRGISSADFAATVIVPYYAIAKAENVQNMSNREIIAIWALDTAFTAFWTLTSIRMTSGFVRSGESLGKAIAKTILADVTAPYQMIRHPVETIKAPFKLLSELTGGVEGKRVPETIIKTSLKNTWGSDWKIPVELGKATPAGQLETVNRLVENVATGTQKAEGLGGIGRIVARDTGIHKIVEPGVLHATADGESVLMQIAKNNKWKVSDELFTAPTGTWFDNMTATGTRGQVQGQFYINAGTHDLKELDQLSRGIAKLEDPAKIESAMQRLNKAGKLEDIQTVGTKQYKAVIEGESKIWAGSELKPVPSGKPSTFAWREPDLAIMQQRNKVMTEFKDLSNKADTAKTPNEKLNYEKQAQKKIEEADNLFNEAVKKGTPQSVKIDVDYVEYYDLLTGENRYLFNMGFADDVDAGLIKAWTQSQKDAMRKEGIKGIFRDITQAHIEYPKMSKDEQILRIAAKINNPEEQKKLGALVDALDSVIDVDITDNKVRPITKLVNVPDSVNDAFITYLSEKKVRVIGSTAEYGQGIDVIPKDTDLASKNPMKTAQDLAEIAGKNGIKTTIKPMKQTKGVHLETIDGKPIVTISDENIRLSGKKGVYEIQYKKVNGIYQLQNPQVPLGYVVTPKTVKTPEGLLLERVADQAKSRLDSIIRPGIRTGKGSFGPEVSGKEERIKDIAKFEADIRLLIAEGKKQAKTPQKLLALELAEKQLDYGLGKTDKLPTVLNSKAELAYRVTPDNVEKLVKRANSNDSKLLPAAIGAGAGIAWAMMQMPKDGDENNPNANLLQLMAAAALVVATDGKAGNAGKLIRSESKITQTEAKALSKLSTLTDKNLPRFTATEARIAQEYFNSARFKNAIGARSVIAAITAIPRSERGYAELDRRLSQVGEIRAAQSQVTPQTQIVRQRIQQIAEMQYPMRAQVERQQVEQLESAARQITRQLPDQQQARAETPRQVAQQLPAGQGIGQYGVGQQAQRQQVERQQAGRIKAGKVLQPEKPIKPIKPVIPAITKKASELTQAEREASVGWIQGKLKGKDGKLHSVYHIVYPPYQQRNHIVTLDRVQGVRFASGPGSAYASLSKMKGIILPKEILLDWGIMDITIQATKKKPHPVMTYKPDVGQKTKQGKVILSR